MKAGFQMTYQELAAYLTSPATLSNTTDEAVLDHFKSKYQSVPYRHKQLFVFNTQRPFDNQYHLIQLHQRNMGQVPYHIYHYVVIMYVYHGRLSLHVEGQPVTLHQGELIILDKSVPHSVAPTSTADLGINIILADDFFDHTMLKSTATNNVLPSFLIELMSQQYAHTHYLIFDTKTLPIIHNCIQNILCEQLSAAINADAIIDDYIAILFTALMRIQPLQTNVDPNDLKTQQLLEKIVAYTRSHYQEGRLSALCQQINYSPSYISKLIRYYTGKTFKQLINEQRMQRAKLLLQDQTLPISDIATAVGINNLTNFYRRFEAATGNTPRDYRQNLKTTKNATRK